MAQSADAFSVLVVDDDDEMREGLCDLLNEKGYEAKGVTDGAEALATLSEPTSPALPDLVLLDLGMPRMDGYEFLERREASPKLKAVPVIVISATTDTHRIHDLVAATLPKPVSVPTLLRVMNQAVLRQRQQRYA